jgi:hypothetical protein
MSAPGKYFYAIRRKSDGAIVCRGYQTEPPSAIKLAEGMEVVTGLLAPEVKRLTDADLTRGTINNGEPVFRP